MKRNWFDVIAVILRHQTKPTTVWVAGRVADRVGSRLP